VEITYDRATQYCPVRRDLEEHTYDLVGRLAALTDRLLALVGRDHQSFLETKSECASARSQVTESRRELDRHRQTHGC
jgi:hypothetical protein